MGQLGGKIQVVDARDSVVIKVEDSEVPANRYVALKKRNKSDVKKNNEGEHRVHIMCTYNILYILVRKVEVGDCPQVFL